MPSDLEDALAAVKAGELTDALAALLGAWRTKPAVELAAAIDHVGAQIDRTLPAIPPDQDEWLAVASRRDHADVGRLLASLVDTFKRMRPRLEALAEFAPDPRISAALVALEIGTSSQSSGPIYTTVFGALEAIGDGRAKATLKQRLPWYRKELDSALAARVPARVEKLLAALAEPPALDAKERKTVAAIAAAKPAAPAKPKPRPAAKPTSIEALIAAVHANPDDDAPRTVLADALQEKGDPRGELIALQLATAGRLPTAAEDKTLRELVKAHGRAWIAPLDAVVDPNTIRFARGFLDSVVVKRKAAHLAGNAMWSTVREIECHELAVILDPVMRALRRVSVTPEELSELARRPAPLPFDTLLGRWLDGRASQWDGLDPDAPAAWADALAVGALASVTGLSIDARGGPATWAFLHKSKLAKQLRRLDATMYGWSEDAGAGGYIAFAESLGPIARLVVRQSYEGKRVAVALDKTPAGWSGVLQISRYDLDRHVPIVLAGARGKIARLSVELAGGAASERFDAAKLAPTIAAAKKFVPDTVAGTGRAAPAEI